MGPDLSVIVADPTRLPAIRAGLQLPGRLMPFTSGNTASALQNIRAYRPKVVAIEALFAESPEGVAFAADVEAMKAGIAVQLIVRRDGKWVATPREADAAAAPIVVASTGVAPPRPVAVPTPTVNTRRAPRFSFRAPKKAAIEDGSALLVNLSVHGAQIVSVPVLRPKQKVKIGLADANDDMLTVMAQVAWSSYERSPSSPEPYYRVGLEFNGTSQEALDAYRRRHCADQPLPIR
jgi:hypothetical protein